MVEVQAQDNLGYWRTHSYVPNESLQIRTAMERLQWLFPGARVRAIDEAGRLVDIM